MAVTQETTQQDVLSKLKEGSIPEWLAEENRMVPPESSEGQKFQAYIDTIAKRIWPDGHYEDHQFRFILCDDETPNGFFIQQAKPPIIGLSKGLIDFLDNEDQLAAVLGHEMQHYRTQLRLGPGANSKLEEYSADIWPVFWLHDAGYNPIEVMSVFEKLTKLSEDKKLSIFDLFDKHGLKENRVKAVKTGLALLDEKNGGIKDVPRTPKEKKAVQAIQQAHHQAFVDFKLQGNSYDGSDNVKKLQALDGLYDTVFPNRVYDRNDLQYKKREQDYLDQLSKLSIDHDNSAEVDAFNMIAHRIIHHHQPDWLLYYAASQAWSPQKEKKAPIGEMIAIADHIQKFLDATSMEGAREAANTFTNLLDATYKDLVTGYIGDPKSVGAVDRIFYLPDWPQFKLPDFDTFSNAIENGEEIRPPWDDHITWAHADDSHIIVRALSQLGIEDHRLYLPYSLEVLIEHAETSYGPERKAYDSRLSTPAGKGLNYKFVHLAEDGSLSFTRSDKEREEMDESRGTTHEEIARSRRRNGILQEKKRDDIPDVSLSDIPERFVEYNAKYLMAAKLPHEKSEYSTQENWDRHIEATQGLIGRFEELLEEDFEQHFEFVRNYFLNNSFSEQGVPHSMDLAYKTYTQRETPFVRFIKDNKFNIFTPMERIKALEVLPFFEGACPGENKRREFDLDYWRNAFDYSKPTSIEELFSLQDRFGYVMSISEADKKLSPFFGSELKGTPYEKRGCITTTNLSLRETEQFLIHQDHSTDDLLKLAVRLENYMTPELCTLIREHVRIDDISDKLDLKILIKAYRTMENSFLFPNDYTRQLMANRLVTRISNIDAPNDRLDYAELALFRYTKPSGKPVSLRNAILKQSLRSIWAEDIVALDGIDNGSDEYFTNAADHRVININSNNGSSDSRELLQLYTDTIESQEQLSDYCKNILKVGGRDEMQNKGLQIAGIEGLLRVLSDDDEARNETIEFLSSPLTSDSIESYIDIFRKSERLRYCISSVYGNDVPDTVLRMVGQDLHTHFWQSPFSHRVVFMDQLLLPAQQGENEKNIEAVFTKVADKLLPEGVEHSKAARALLKAYLKTTPDYQKSLLLSAMMVAVEQVESSNENVSMGRRLAMVLEMRGPAGKKFGQALHSNPSTPEDIREGTEHFKSMSEPGTRWDLWDRLRDIVPRETIEKIDHLGKVIGAASYYVSVRADKVTESSVFSLLRENAQSKAEEEFRRLAETARVLAEEDTEFSKVSNVLIQSVEQAKEASAIEADCHFGEKQAAVAKTIYNNTEIEVDGYRFKFSAAQWLGHGDEFKETSLIKGEHFIDLTTDTDDKIKHKRAVAKAYLTLEFNQIASGKGFDRDRHGAQLRVEGNGIGIFDHGLLDLDLPSQDEKRLLGKVLYKIFEAHKEEKDLAATTVEAIQFYKDTKGNIPSYLLKTQQALLALADFYNCEYSIDGSKFKLLSQQDLQDVIEAVFNNGIDTDVAKSMRQEFTKAKGPFVLFKNALKTLLNSVVGKRSSLIQIHHTPAKNEVV